MTTAIKILGNIFGVSTFLMMFLGFLTVVTGGSLGIEEITVMMFTCVIMATWISMSRPRGKKEEERA